MVDRKSEAKAQVPRGNGTMWRLDTASSVEDGTAVLVLEGRLAHATNRRLAAAARALAALPGVRELVLDLSGVDYLNSGALAVLDSLESDLTARGGRLAIRRPSVPARLALELAGARFPALD